MADMLTQEEIDISEMLIEDAQRQLGRSHITDERRAELEYHIKNMRSELSRHYSTKAYPKKREKSDKWEKKESDAKKKWTREKKRA